MTWAGQLRQLWKREITRVAPLLGLYVLLLALAVARAADWPAWVGAGDMPTALAVWLCLLVVSALCVHRDSPVRADAFWATQPVQPTAVAAVKLLVLLLFVLLCATALFAVSSVWQYAPFERVALTMSVTTRMAVLAVGASLAASVCSSLTVAGTITAAMMMPLLLLNGREWPIGAVGPSVWHGLLLVMLAAGVSSLLWVYRRRPRDWSARGATMALSGILVTMGGVDAPSFRTPETRSPDPRADVSLHIPLGNGAPLCDDGMLTIPLELVAPAWTRVELTRSEVALYLASGDSVRLENRDWIHSAGLWGPLVPASLHGAVTDDEPTVAGVRRRRADVAFRLSSNDRERVCGHVRRIALRMRMRATIGAELMRIPLRGESVARIPGLRAIVADEFGGDSTGALSVRLSRLAATAGPSLPALADLEFAVRHIARGDIVRLENRAGTWMRTSDLPGLTRTQGTQRLEWYQPVLRREPVRTMWRGDAELIVTSPVTSASTSVAASATVPAPLAGMTERRARRPE